jgi:hypothetical protein
VSSQAYALRPLPEAVSVTPSDHPANSACVAARKDALALTSPCVQLSTHPGRAARIGTRRSTLNSHLTLKIETPTGSGPAGISPGGKRMAYILLLLPIMLVVFDVKVKIVIKKR